MERNEAKKHLLLLVIELPFRLIKWSWIAFNYAFGFPLYAYFFIIERFLTAESFKKSLPFIIIFSPIRICCFLLSFIFPAIEIIALMSLITKTIEDTKTIGKLAIYLTFCSIFLSIMGFNWFGLYRLSKKLNWLKPFSEYKSAMKNSFYYFVSIPFTLILILVPLRVRRLLRYRQKDNIDIELKEYCVFVIVQTIKLIGTIITLPISVIIVILPWRLWETINEVGRTQSEIDKKIIILIQVGGTLIDFVVCPVPILLILFTFYKFPSLIRKLDPRRGSK